MEMGEDKQTGMEKIDCNNINGLTGKWRGWRGWRG